MTGRERLAKLANFLRHDVRLIKTCRQSADFKFDLRAWASADKIGLGRARCNTSACAVGWATTIFRRQGFKLEAASPVNRNIVPVYKDKRNWEAVQEFFAISDAESSQLFSKDAYPSDQLNGPVAVADRIESFLNTSR
jgi:hypothetical protein